VALTRRQLFLSGLAGLAPVVPAPGIIDSHVHVWKVDPNYPFIAQGKQPAPARDASPEALLALMKAHGVSKSVLVQVSHHGWDHRFVADTLRRHPRAFIGVARVNPEDPAAPATLERLVKQDGFRGLRLNVQPESAYDWVRGPLMPPLWRMCDALQIPLCLQTKGPRLPDLIPLCQRFAGLTVIVDHMADIVPGDHASLDALLALAKRPRTYVKISHTWWVSKQAYPYADALDQVKRLCDAFGPQRLLYGSDWPGVEKYCAYDRALALVDQMKFLAPSDRAAVLGGNAARIWPT
jgi:L-fuconolactonase